MASAPAGLSLERHRDLAGRKVRHLPATVGRSPATVEEAVVRIEGRRIVVADGTELV